MGALVAAGYTVLAVNPLSTSRYRERHSTSGAKWDPGDARVLPELACTDAHNHRPITGDGELAEFRLGIEDEVNQVTNCRWEVAFWASENDPCLQVADYCTWAVQRKYEMGDERSYHLIEPKIRSEYDYFQWGRKYYY